jgi:release factor glutamine methyltransferase
MDAARREKKEHGTLAFPFQIYPALDGSEDGLYFYRVLALECSKHLNKGGCVYFEIGYDQAEAVSRILTIAGYREIEVIKDEPGLNRVVKARWNR